MAFLPGVVKLRLPLLATSTEIAVNFPLVGSNHRALTGRKSWFMLMVTVRPVGT